MLPNHGVTHAVFLLGYTARLNAVASLDQLIGAARTQSTYLASATDLRTPATRLLELGLLAVGRSVTIDSQLDALFHNADQRAMHGIARVLLKAAPPFWLWSAVHQGKVLREYIPSADLAALSWLEPHLDTLLVSVHLELDTGRQQNLAKQIGDAAELILMAAYAYEGHRPIHVARYHDGCGYDIELPGSPIDRIEVKAASVRTQGQFRLTRNEYDKARLWGSEWRLIQLVFSQQAFFAERISGQHVVDVLDLSADAILRLAPADTPEFRWMESAEFTPAVEDWRKISINFDPNFTTSGFGLSVKPGLDKQSAHAHDWD